MKLLRSLVLATTGLALCLTWSAGSAHAAAEPPAPKTAEPYRFGPGDTIQVIVEDEKDLSGDLTIAPDGYVYYPFVGKVKLNGLTVDEATQALVDSLKSQLKYPRVAIGIKEFRPQAASLSQVLVFGQVAKPGAYPITTQTYVLDVLAEVGGVTPDADAKNVRIYRSGGKSIPLDLQALIDEGKLANNVLLQPGDVLFVPSKVPVETGYVTVLGQVGQPGLLPVKKDERLISVLARAGGLKEDADAKHTVIVRNNTRQMVDLQALLDGESLEPTIVHADDMVIVPRVTPSQVIVLAEGSLPATVKIRPGMKLLDAIAESGALQQTSSGVPGEKPTGVDLSRVQIIRRDGVLETDITDAIRKGSLSANIDVKDGDIILLSAKDRVYVFGAVNSPGPYGFKRGDKVLDAVRGAGWTTPEADLRRTTILRQRNGTPTLLNIDLQDLVDNGNVSQNAALQAGDIIVVPGNSTKKKLGINDLLGWIYPLDLIFNFSGRRR